MRVSKNKNIFISILVIILIFSPIIVCNCSQNEIIDKEIKIGKRIKPLDQEGNTYRLVTSADNVQVPVPKGYVASQVTGENYVTPQYQHTTNTYKGNYTELTWSSPAGEQYPWSQDSNGIWISGNQGIPSSTSTLESEEFDYIKGSTLTINYTFSSSAGDYTVIELMDLTNNIIEKIVPSKYGNTGSSFNYINSTYTWKMNNGGMGRYKIRATYSKNASGNGGQDSSYIKASTYFKEDQNGETIEVDQKTRIHDGGFVIYQLTDEEIETDPNGTSVVINDTNKDEAQASRNQYVWVPISNVEDLIRTKADNGGIMQFGQVYRFSNTSIIKETSTVDSYYREPKLTERDDKSKFYLQQYSNINKREDYLNNMQEDFVIMLKSINKYKGFYIERYETGDDISHNSSRTCFKNPKIVRYNSNIGDVTWYDSYKDLERLSGKTGEYVETGMLYDTLFEYTLKWLNDTDTKSYYEINSDSETWGNYKNNTVKYKESANGIERTETIASPKKTPSGGAIEITHNGELYGNSPTSSNNIFDLAGNMGEWTRGVSYNGGRSSRGGDYSFSMDVYSVVNVEGLVPYNNMGNSGVRAQLYIL